MLWNVRTLRFALVASLAFGVGCKDDSNSGVCDPADANACSGGQVCELVSGGDPACFDPVVLNGNVFDAQSQVPVSGASVVALDVSGGALTTDVTTDAAGNYSIRVPATRDADGNVIASTVTLRVDASGYLPFAQAPRVAIPIDLTTGVLTNGELIIDNATTDVSLFALPAGTERGSIEGSITGLDVGGALVVAEQGVPAVAVSTAIVRPDGTFVLYNVPTNVSTNVTAYAAGANVSTATISLSAPTPAGQVSLTADATGLANVMGSISPVAGPTWSASSVILVVESTFSNVTNAGYTPVGLRDGTVVPSDTSFSIVGVPPGRYVVLASFENDGLVRDPDVAQAGTSIRTVEVSDTGAVTVTSAPQVGEDLNGIKVTDPIDIVGPGATGLEVVALVPTFVWAKYPGTDHYEFRIYDAFGTKVYEDLAVAQPSGGTASYDLVGGSFIPAQGAVSLTTGMIYQFEVVAIKTGGSAISSTEDMLGVFQYQP